MSQLPQVQSLGMNAEMPKLQNSPSDIVPPDDRNDITNIDERALSGFITGLFRSSIRDKEYFGWVAKRKYDLEAYYMIKNEALRHTPWEGASNSRVPLTPTLLDTAHANVKASMWSDAGDPVKVKGVAAEDVRKAPILQDYMNWKVNNEMDMETPMDSNIFRTFLHGTGFMKVIRNFDNSIRLSSLDIENIYLPIDASGMTMDDTDHVIQMVPLTYNDLQVRKPFYKGIESIAPGVGISNGIAPEQLMRLKDVAFGTSMQQRAHRDLFYIMEVYLTYYEPMKSSGPTGPMSALKPKELIVWMSPHGGTIHRIRENVERIRPFSEYYAYPEPGRIFAMSLPEKIKGIQEDIDYAWKQNTDANDRAISPAMFVDDTSTFDRTRAQRVPSGIYNVGRNNTIQWEQQPPVDRGFERSIQNLWFQGEQLTGLIDVTIGGGTKSGRTLGETQIRTTRADIRFSTVMSRMEKGWKKTLDIVYEYVNRYEDRSKKLRVVGYADLKSIDEIFPTENPDAQGLAIEGKYDFSFGGSPITEREQERQNTIGWAQAMMANPIVASNPANLWRVSKIYSEAMGQRDLEVIVTKPKEVDIYSVQEFIQRVMSGQYEIQIRPGIDTETYIFEIQLFMQTDSFQSLDPRGQQTLQDALRRAYVMSVAEKQALMDLQHVQQAQQIGAMQAQQPGMPGQPSVNPGQPPQGPTQ